MESFTLKNNIKVLFNRTTGAEVVAARIMTPVSVINETSDKSGISHLTAKLMAHSTKNRSSEILAKDTENIGAYLSTDVDYDTTEIGMFFLPEYFDKAAEILADVIINPAFDEKELSFKKQTITAILDSRKDSIGCTASDEFKKIFYRNVPYSTPILGSKETISKLNREDLIKWHQYSYNASNILISISGNVDEKIVRQSLEKYFSNVPTGVKFEMPAFNIKHAESIKKEIKGKFNQAYIYMGFPAPNLYDKDFAAINIASVLNGGRMTSRLFIELREKLGLAYAVGAVYPSRREESHFAVYIGLDKKNIDLTLKKIDEILKDFCTVKISEQELKDTKTYMKGTYVMSRQTVWEQSYYYGLREVTGKGYQYDTEFIKDIEKVTTQDIINVANKVFSQNSVTVIINPNEK
ncbi:MAG: insulinase family protein [Endomicrobium sp.]|uniref:M16 family metallopeptidase n=1 Tax=Candidatus Endomicrobiellum pyrsonymphae TaxID=1408203 RepID=UPI003587228E|nr:insulinase family protein [Endomicrobium sp.]